MSIYLILKLFQSWCFTELLTLDILCIHVSIMLIGRNVWAPFERKLLYILERCILISWNQNEVVVLSSKNLVAWAGVRLTFNGYQVLGSIFILGFLINVDDMQNRVVLLDSDIISRCQYLIHMQNEVPAIIDLLDVERFDFLCVVLQTVDLKSVKHCSFFVCQISSV